MSFPFTVMFDIKVGEVIYAEFIPASLLHVLVFRDPVYFHLVGKPVGSGSLNWYVSARIKHAVAAG